MNNDLISRKALKKEMDRPFWEKWEWEFICKSIDNAPTVGGEWIPVGERLPDKNMSCLVSVGKFNITQIAMYSDLMGSRETKIFYQGDYGKNSFQNITAIVNAWQPLPKQYKGDI